MSGRFGFLLVVERGEQLVRGRLDRLELLLPLLAHLGDERKAIRRVHLADGLWIDALTRRLHRGGGILDRLGVLAPGLLLSGRDAELDLQLIDVLGIGEAPARGAMHHARPHALHHSVAVHHAVTHAHAAHAHTHVLHHSGAHATSALAMHERGTEAARTRPDGLRQGPPAHQRGCDRKTADYQSFLLHVRLQFFRNSEVRCWRIGGGRVH